MRAIELMEEKQVSPDLLYALINPQLEALADMYKSSGYELRIVGGAVRDILLNKEPKDIDLATDATPEESIRILRDNDIKMIPTGLAHGTVTAHIEGIDYEITTLRVDVETDGRHAEVEYTTDWELDAERRDLTFNAMSLDFDGNLFDYFGGFEDLKKGVARFVGNTRTRVEEDYLRILRYFRFQGRMDIPKFDDKAMKAIKRASKGLKNISGERIWSEMKKIFSGNHLRLVMLYMNHANIFENIGLPFYNTMSIDNLMSIKTKTNNPLLLLSSILNNQEELLSLSQQWKFSNKEKNLMSFVIENRGNIIDIDDAKKMLVLQGENKAHIMALLIYQGNKHLVQEIKNWKLPLFPISGNDLKAAGIRPGPEMGIILQQLKNKWADSGFSLSKDELLS